MTDKEKEEYRGKVMEQVMLYCRIDYDDDKEILEIMLDVAMQEMAELIPDFDAYSMTQRQRLLSFAYVKELYDNREKYGKDTKRMQNAVSSMLLKEMYKGGMTG